MTNQLIKKEVLNMLTRNADKDNNMAYSYIDIERYLVQNRFLNGPVLDYGLPYNKDFSLSLRMANGHLELAARNKDNVVHMDVHKTMLELQEKGEQFRQMLRDNHITLAPLPDTQFMKTIVEAEKGSVINLNNKTAIVCVGEHDGSKIFKKQFDGSMSDININSFRLSDTFVINPQNHQDLHYLYGKAYSSRTTSASIRVSDMTDGQYICTDIEKNMINGSSRKVSVGPLELIVIKDSSGEISWYDGTGTRIDRETAGTIFGWATNTIPEITEQEWASNDQTEGFTGSEIYGYSEFLTSIKENTVLRDFDAIINDAFAYAENTGNGMTLTFNDLEKDDKGNFICATYAFKSAEGGGHIYRLTYENNIPGGWVQSAEEVSRKDFIRFCEKKYDDTYQHIINTNEQTIARLMTQGETRESAEEIILKVLNEREGFNIFGITESDISVMNEKATLLLQNMGELSKETSVAEFMNPEDIEIGETE